MGNTRPNSNWLVELRDHGGDGHAAEELRGYVRRGLSKALQSRGVHDADLDDFAQDAMIRILESLDSFRGDSRFTTWAMAVALRTAFGVLRRRRHDLQPLDQLELESIELSVTGADPADVAEQRDLLDALQESIHRDLTPRQRTAILGELSGVPTTVLAERLGIIPNALYKLHHDARRKLRRAMNDAGFGDDDVRQELTRATNAT